MSRQQLKEKGFTIIEVVLVLAIAALIFLMVFIALPALQRNQRDTARKQEVGKVLGAVTSYQSNNRGATPSADETFAKYLDGTSSESVITLGTGTQVSFVDGEGILPDSNDMIYVFVGGACDGSNKLVAGESSRKAAAGIKLENGDAPYCQEG